MFNRSIKNTILINAGAFLLVAILEILSIWASRDNFETAYSFYMHGINYTLYIMVIIWINHFIFIPFLLDKRRYVLYGILVIGIIF